MPELDVSPLVLAASLWHSWSPPKRETQYDHIGCTDQELVLPSRHVKRPPSWSWGCGGRVFAWTRQQTFPVRTERQAQTLHPYHWLQKEAICFSEYQLQWGNSGGMLMPSCPPCVASWEHQVGHWVVRDDGLVILKNMLCSISSYPAELLHFSVPVAPSLPDSRLISSI